MKRRKCLKSGSAATLAALVARRAPARETAKPNLLFIMTDQQRWDAMSCAGNPVLKTPNMDRLAREGVMFKNFYSSDPVCVPARAVLLTGLSPVNVRVENNGDYDREDVPDVPTFDSILKQHGYAAEYYGKWHTPYKFTACYDNDVREVGSHGNKNNRSQQKAYTAYLRRKGVEQKDPGPQELYSKRHTRPYIPVRLDWSYDKLGLDTKQKVKLRASQASQYGCVDLPPRISYTAFTAEETLEALDRLKDKPFTLTCSFDPPHPPMVVQKPYFGLYPPDKIPVPENIADPMDHSPYKERAAKDKELKYNDPRNIRDMRSIYYGMVREVDDWLGEILKKLDDLGLTENTLVIFTSDHGEMLGDHGMHSKMIFYEGSVHVPLLMRFPGRIKPGTGVETPVNSMNLCPTILDYLDMPIPKCDGISLRPLIEGKKVEHTVVSYSPGTRTPNYMIRSGNLKLMMAEKDKNSSIDALYDLAADPLEMNNLLTTPNGRKLGNKLKAQLVQWMEKHEPHKAADLKARTLRT